MAELYSLVIARVITKKYFPEVSGFIYGPNYPFIHSTLYTFFTAFLGHLSVYSNIYFASSGASEKAAVV